MTTSRHGGRTFLARHLTQEALFQFLRYGTVGLSLNLGGYLLYLWLTHQGADPSLVVAVCYPLGVAIGYLSHRRFSFRATSGMLEPRIIVRYVTAYGIGCVLNLLLLEIFWRRLGIPHPWVQAAAIFIVAGALFLMLRYVVWGPSVGVKEQEPS